MSVSSESQWWLPFLRVCCVSPFSDKLNKNSVSNKNVVFLPHLTGEIWFGGERLCIRAPSERNSVRSTRQTQGQAERKRKRGRGKRQMSTSRGERNITWDSLRGRQSSSWTQGQLVAVVTSWPDQQEQDDLFDDIACVVAHFTYAPPPSNYYTKPCRYCNDFFNKSILNSEQQSLSTPLQLCSVVDPPYALRICLLWRRLIEWKKRI